MASSQQTPGPHPQEALGGMPPRRSRTLWIWLLLLVVIAGFFVLRARKEAPEAAVAVEAAPMQLLPSEIYEIRAAPLRDTVQITGSLSPVRALQIPAEVSGRVDAVRFEPGNAVKEGDELVAIDVQTLRNRLEQQKATAEATRVQLSLAQVQLERIAGLVKRGVSTTAALESDGAQVAQLEANYSALRRQVDLAEDDLAKARITAPFAGVISKRNVDPGTYATLGMSLMELVDVSELELEGGVPVNFAPQLKAGQTVELTVDGLSEHHFTGVIERIAPVAVAATRVLPVYVRIPNPEGLLSGGMFASGQLVLAENASAIGIPATALRKDEAGEFVLKIDNGKAIRQAVEVQRSWDRGRLLELRSGLSEGDRIIGLELERLQPDMAVALAER